MARIKFERGKVEYPPTMKNMCTEAQQAIANLEKKLQIEQMESKLANNETGELCKAIHSLDMKFKQEVARDEEDKEVRHGPPRKLDIVKPIAHQLSCPGSSRIL